MKLQCDRACEGAEITPSHIGQLYRDTLQCDRACEGAEILVARAGRVTCTVRFNVTAPVKARKSSSQASPAPPPPCFNVTAPVKARK